MDSGSSVEGAIIACVGASLAIAGMLGTMGVWKNRPAALACLVSGSLLCVAGQVLGRLELLTASWAALSNQTLVVALAGAVTFMIGQAWHYGKPVSPPADVTSKT